MFGGDAGRSAAARAGMPLLDPTIRFKLVETKEVADRLAQAVTLAENAGRVVLPAATPIAVTIQDSRGAIPVVVFRSHNSIEAVNLKTHAIHWKAPADGSLERLLTANQSAVFVQSWLNLYVTNLRRPEILLENSTIGTLSTDGRLVFAVDDLAVPPPQTVPDPFGPPLRENLPAMLKKAVGASELKAYSLSSGKLAWIANSAVDAELADTYFLGPPLPLDGKLFVLAEKKQDLRLITLDPAKGKVLAVQVLGTPRTGLLNDPIRRTQAAHLAGGDGVLVCPTNAGAVLGVDLLSGTLRWVYAYGEPNAPPPLAPRFPRPGFPVVAMPAHDKWKTSAPVVRDGKVVFAAPDGNALHCLAVRDGALVWKSNRQDDDLYFAGVGVGKALIVGKKTVRALSLDTGKALWTLETGLPSGHGAFGADGLYYLPLSSAAKDRKPGVLALDVAKGTVVALARPRNNIAPGNLVFFDGQVLSQTATELIVYPQLAQKIKETDEALKANPNDPAALTERGVLRLEKGDVAGAVEDLRAALANKPSKEVLPRTRERLHEALTEYLKRDFKAAEKYLKEYEELLKPDRPPEEMESEARRRRITYLVLLARGREGQGKAVEALRAYLDLAGLGRGADLLTAEEPDLRIAPALWVRGRVVGLKATTAEEQTALSAEIESRAESVRAGKHLDALRGFTDVFGGMPIGGEMRLLLARRLIDDKQYLEADLHLQQLRGEKDRLLAGRAIELLGRLHTLQGTMPDAVHYYRLLAAEFADVKVRDGKTGKALFAALSTDKRFLPYLEPQPRTEDRKYKAAVIRDNFPIVGTSAVLRQVGERLPFFRDHAVAHRLDQSELRLVSSDGREIWSQDVTASLLPNFTNQLPTTSAFPMATIGHLVLIPRGQFMTAFDPLAKQVLWEKNLHGVPVVPGLELPLTASSLTDPRDGAMQLAYPNENWVQRVGQVPPLGPEVVCLHTRQGLLAVHPLTGETLWTRGGFGGHLHVWGDDRHVYVVEMSNGGMALQTHVFRLADGSVLPSPNFADSYNHRLHTIGTGVLVSETTPDHVVLRLYEPSAGKDVWKRTAPPGSQVLSNADPELAGFVEPEGKVVIVVARTGKEVLQSTVDSKQFGQARAIHAWMDEHRVYLACNGPTDTTQIASGPYSNFMLGSGLRSVPVNGEVIAFDRATGKRRWQMTVADQFLLLDDGRDLPVLLFASRVVKNVGIGGVPRTAHVAGVQVLSKSSGKLYLDERDAPAGNLFHTVAFERTKGRFELLGTMMKVSLFAVEEKP